MNSKLQNILFMYNEQNVINYKIGSGNYFHHHRNVMLENPEPIFFKHELLVYRSVIFEHFVQGLQLFEIYFNT